MSGSILAETWELSCHPDGPSYIADGPYTGLTLAQYVETQGKKVLGTHCEKFEDFPILIKLVLVRKWVGEGQRDSKFQEFTSLMVWQ